MRRSASEVIRELEIRVARLERSATSAPEYDPREQAHNRQSKISHLLRIILDNCPTLNDFERGFINDMLRLLNRRRGIEPSTALSEKQARKLRQIIFKRHRDYKHAVPSLPAGVKFEDEVRRLLKSQPNPNEARNQLIREGEAIIRTEIKKKSDHSNMGYYMDGGTKWFYSEPRYEGTEGDNLLFSFDETSDSLSHQHTRYIYKVNMKSEKATLVSEMPLPRR
jgi:hypothetical protein